MADAGVGGWGKELGKTWDAVSATNSDVDELRKMFAPHAAQLKKAGHTPASYVRMLVGIAQQLDTNPAQTLTALGQRYGLIENDGSGHDPVAAAQFSDEWSRFSAAHPDAELVRHQMGQVLAAAPEREGETVAAAISRAYGVVTGSEGNKAAPAAAAAPAEPESSEPKNWHDEASDAWDEVLGDAESISDSDEDDDQHAE